jgi:hypothetical protein
MSQNVRVLKKQLTAAEGGPVHFAGSEFEDQQPRAEAVPTRDLLTSAEQKRAWRVASAQPESAHPTSPLAIAGGTEQALC